MSATAPQNGSKRRRWILMIPLIAIALIAPTACYYEDYGYSYPAAKSYGSSYGYGGNPYYSPRYESNSRYRGYDSRGYSYSHSSEYRQQSYENNRERSENYRKSREKAIESQKEARSEGYKFEPRDERSSRRGFSEENYEERKN